jgi:8-oxo-dGTP pyrophosphatase MutT (NUDIX family)
MKLYIHNLEIRIKQGPVVRNKVRFKSVHSKWDINFLINDQCILVTGENEFDVNNILKSLIDSKTRVFKRLTFIVDDLSLFKDFMINEFKSVPAAGGLVRKHGELLVIKRHGLWDIPKGKIEKGEKKKDAAVREVEEECGVKVKLGEKIGKTLHLYKMKGKYAFKYTHWYRMTILSEKDMKPQKSEGIEDVRWMSQEEVSKMDNYASITGILETYFEYAVI